VQEANEELLQGAEEDAVEAVFLIKGRWARSAKISIQYLPDNFASQNYVYFSLIDVPD
jgi:hypothetical protein